MLCASAKMPAEQRLHFSLSLFFSLLSLYWTSCLWLLPKIRFGGKKKRIRSSSISSSFLFIIGAIFLVGSARGGVINKCRSMAGWLARWLRMYYYYYVRTTYMANCCTKLLDVLSTCCSNIDHGARSIPKYSVQLSTPEKYWDIIC